MTCVLVLCAAAETIFYIPGYGLRTATSALVGARILFTFLCVRVWGLDLQAVWFCMIADNVCKAILFAFAFPFLGKKGRERLLSL